MDNGLNFVMGVNIVIWVGIAAYFFILDRKIKKLEKLVESQKDNNNKIQ